MKVGDEIVVLMDRGRASYVMRARARRVEPHIFMYWTAETQSRYGVVSFADEGVTWAKGWDTQEANALRAATALTPPAR